jgi:hypothetical protein
MEIFLGPLKSPNDPAILFLGIYKKELRSGTQTNICTLKYVITLFKWTEVEATQKPING